MADAVLSVTIEELKGSTRADINKLIRDRQQVLLNSNVPMGMIATQIYRSTMLNFQTEGARTPDGKWASLKPSTLENRIHGRSGGSPKILQDKGIMRGSITPYYDNDTAKAYTNVPYATTHQQGARKGQFGTVTVTVPQHVRKVKIEGKARRQKQIVKTHTRKMVIPWGDIPKRAFLVLNNDDITKIVNIAKRWIAGKIA